ncbi:hypothetical protein C8R43DRAFT_952022 [Mycena crocata]|nr:hypothetical protein C8R43DRAFT_952022 [Mycena crocata]
MSYVAWLQPLEEDAAILKVHIWGIIWDEKSTPGEEFPENGNSNPVMVKEFRGVVLDIRRAVHLGSVGWRHILKMGPELLPFEYSIIVWSNRTSIRYLEDPRNRIKKSTPRSLQLHYTGSESVSQIEMFSAHVTENTWMKRTNANIPDRGKRLVVINHMGRPIDMELAQSALGARDERLKAVDWAVYEAWLTDAEGFQNFRERHHRHIFVIEGVRRSEQVQLAKAWQDTRTCEGLVKVEWRVRLVMPKARPEALKPAKPSPPRPEPSQARRRAFAGLGLGLEISKP